MKNLITFEQCCEYLGISKELPKCQVDEKKLQAVYKLRVCMKAWNKIDGFEPDETASYYQKEGGYTPHFDYKDGRMLPSGNAATGSSAGIIYAYAYLHEATSYTPASFGLRLCLKTTDRAVEFGEVFIETFNELV